MASTADEFGGAGTHTRPVIPCSSYGAGEPFVFFRALPGSTGNPRGFDRLLELWMLRGPLRHHRVLAIGCPIQLPEHVTMPELAGLYAKLLESRFGRAVPVMGFSTGASVALQLAVDRPDLVSSLVVAAGACRLSNQGREYQRQYIRGLQQRDRAAPAELVGSMLTSANALTVARVVAQTLPRPSDPSDLIALLGAEDDYDVTDRLGEIDVPTLVISGERDVFYPPELGDQTAQGVQDGRHIVYRGSVHVAVPIALRFTRDVLGFLAAHEA